MKIPGVERATFELRSWSLKSSEKVSERLQHLAVPYASLAVLSATRAKDAMDTQEMPLLTPRGSVVGMNRRSTFNDEDPGEVVDLSGHGT